MPPKRLTNNTHIHLDISKKHPLEMFQSAPDYFYVRNMKNGVIILT